MLSGEQLAVIHHSGDLKVPSFAGSGKSTTLQHYILSRPKEKILYQCFNKSTREQFQARITKLNINTVTVSTAHSIAKRAVYGYDQIQLTGGYSLPYLCEILHNDLKGIPTNYHLLLAHHTLTLIRNFCHSLDRKIQHFNYLSTVSKEQYDIVYRYYQSLIGMATEVLRLMHTRKIAVLHDYYLKLYYLNPTQLNYDTILYDEFQDSSPVMAHVINIQKSKKMYVGDPHQLIYGWRGAVDNFQLIPSSTLRLSQSFRFGPKISTLANHILSWKNLIFKNLAPIDKVEGLGPGSSEIETLFLSRGTVNLIRGALHLIERNPSVTYSFIGGIHSYLAHEQGYTIHDVINLHQEKYSFIKNPFISSFSSYSQLTDYATAADDSTLSGMVELISVFKKQLPYLLRKLENKAIQQQQPHDVTFSTAHRAKGLEAKNVILSDDFKTLKELLHSKRLGVKSHQQLIEEVNILYVALTRATHNLELDTKYLN